jgi:hypothetical protein
MASSISRGRTRLFTSQLIRLRTNMHSTGERKRKMVPHMFTETRSTCNSAHLYKIWYCSMYSELLWKVAYMCVAKPRTKTAALWVKWLNPYLQAGWTRYFVNKWHIFLWNYNQTCLLCKARSNYFKNSQIWHNMYYVITIFYFIRKFQKVRFVSKNLYFVHKWRNLFHFGKFLFHNSVLYRAEKIFVFMEDCNLMVEKPKKCLAAVGPWDFKTPCFKA